MGVDIFGRDLSVYYTAEHWKKVNDVGMSLTCFEAGEIVQKFSDSFAKLLLNNNSHLPALALIFALQCKGIPPVLRSVFPTDRQIYKGSGTRPVMIFSDVLWLCACGVSLHRSADDVIASFKKKKYADALSGVYRLTHFVEGLLASRAFGQQDRVRNLLQFHRSKLIILPYLFERPARKIEPMLVKRRLVEGGQATLDLPDGNQIRHLDYRMVYSALYAADCFTTGKGYAEAARYYNALTPKTAKKATRFYMSTMCRRMRSELSKEFIEPMKPAKNGV